MIIKIVEHRRESRMKHEEGTSVPESFLTDTGREWTIDIPITQEQMNWHVNNVMYNFDLMMNKLGGVLSDAAMNFRTHR